MKKGQTTRVSLLKRLRLIAEIIEGAENRCLAADGPVTPTSKEIGEEELRAIYNLASGTDRAL